MAKKLTARYIVADPKICHGRPTFRGTRIMVWQVLEMVADGEDWDKISNAWVSAIPKEAIAEAVSLAAQVFVAHVNEYAIERGDQTTNGVKRYDSTTATQVSP